VQRVSGLLRRPSRVRECRVGPVRDKSPPGLHDLATGQMPASLPPLRRGIRFHDWMTRVFMPCPACAAAPLPRAAVVFPLPSPVKSNIRFLSFTLTFLLSQSHQPNRLHPCSNVCGRYRPGGRRPAPGHKRRVAFPQGRPRRVLNLSINHRRNSSASNIPWRYVPHRSPSSDLTRLLRPSARTTAAGIVHAVCESMVYLIFPSRQMPRIGVTRRDAFECLLHGQRRCDRQQSQPFDGPVLRTRCHADRRSRCQGSETRRRCR